MAEMAELMNAKVIGDLKGSQSQSEPNLRCTVLELK